MNGAITTPASDFQPGVTANSRSARIGSRALRKVNPVLFVSRSLAACAAVAALLGAASAGAAERVAKAPAHAASPAARAGLRVYIDPDTGEHLAKPKTSAHRLIADDL